MDKSFDAAEEKSRLTDKYAVREGVTDLADYKFFCFGKNI